MEKNILFLLNRHDGKVLALLERLDFLLSVLLDDRNLKPTSIGSSEERSHLINEVRFIWDILNTYSFDFVSEKIREYNSSKKGK
jgi:hypothetical protein